MRKDFLSIKKNSGFSYYKTCYFWHQKLKRTSVTLSILDGFGNKMLLSSDLVIIFTFGGNRIKINKCSWHLVVLFQEFKCEICGNHSYWGRRAYERHFKEWRHQHGMRCLGIPNTKNFNEITSIEVGF